MLFQERNALHHHAPVHGFAHVVDGEQGHLHRGERFHLHASGADGFHGGGALDAVVRLGVGIGIGVQDV